MKSILFEISGYENPAAKKQKTTICQLNGSPEVE